MIERKKFLIKLSGVETGRLSQAIALLWYYDIKREYEERTVSDLAQDIKDDSFGLPDATKLRKELKRCKFVVRGSRPDSFRVNATHVSELNKKYGPLANFIEVEVTSSIIPANFIKPGSSYFERMVYQINGSYDYGFYDACAVMVRRLMESIIVEIYLKSGKISEIKKGVVVFQLGELIKKIVNDKSFHLSRNLSREMATIKELGDLAAHDRSYITQPEDIDDNKTKIRKVISELLSFLP